MLVTQAVRLRPQNEAQVSTPQTKTMGFAYVKMNQTQNEPGAN
jgi:hypothetical protein